MSTKKKNRKQKRIEAKDRADNKRFMTIVVVATVLLIVLLYVIFNNTVG